MHITWMGNTGIKIQAKPLAEDVFVVIDPYKTTTGVFARSATAHIALYTRGSEESITISGDPFILETAGEVEVKDILVNSVAGDEPGKYAIRIDSEQLSLGHLGMIKKPLNEMQISALSGVDVLFVPVGGGDTYDPEEAVKAINELEPRIVIPMAYQSDVAPKALPVTNFLREMGAANTEPEKKAIIRKKDLPQEDTKVIVLAKE
ncbi:MAG TPA: MBL fold metallo-hydrolase [Candidatus Magasanikbacteria bacterium]|nr:MBL fold metallo-hydrolase [Candidatus Magasanikbacteria bacterium]